MAGRCPWQSRHNIKLLKTLIGKGFEIEEIEKIVGYAALSPDQQMILHVTRIARNDFLVQNAFDENDVYSSRSKTSAMLEAIVEYYSFINSVFRKSGDRKFDREVESRISGMKASDEKGAEALLKEIKDRLAYV